ncbi:hypothetical protein C4565_01760 [Candidatus Parcubacteria bacterium]|jgi:hypothetical protein|nr:MAG: hypothetical protein C4565_01760 [Candidatus Parcubacteria bacterium]
MKKIKKCNIIVTVTLCSMFVFILPVNAQTMISDNPLSIFKDIVPDQVKEIFDIADQAQKKLESKFGIDIQKMATGGVLPGSNAGSSQQITPEYTKNLLERVSGLISSTNPADAPDFVGRATDIVRQFIKYIIGIMRQIIDMI